MHMVHFRTAVVLGALVSACGIGVGDKHGVAMDPSAVTAFEGQHLWGRPIETGIELGEEIEGQADSVSVLWGLYSSGPEDAESGGPLAFFSGIVEGKPDPIVMSAAGKATEGKADGIYVTHQQVTGFNVFGIYKTRHAAVSGKAIRLKVIGQVNQERYDRDRALTHLGRGALVLPAGLVEAAPPPGSPQGSPANSSPPQAVQPTAPASTPPGTPAGRPPAR